MLHQCIILGIRVKGSKQFRYPYSLKSPFYRRTFPVMDHVPVFNKKLEKVSKKTKADFRKEAGHAGSDFSPHFSSYSNVIDVYVGSVAVSFAFIGTDTTCIFFQVEIISYHLAIECLKV